MTYEQGREVARLYDKERKSVRWLAETYEVSQSKIYETLHKHGVKVRIKKGSTYNGGNRHKGFIRHLSYADYVRDDFIMFCRQRIKNKKHLKYFGTIREEAR